MTALARRDDAAAPLVAPFSRNESHDLWREAVELRQEWLGHGLSTQPADRRIAEQSLAALYARVRRPRPRFVWVDSPHRAEPLITGLPTLDQLYARIRAPRPPRGRSLASDLAMVASQLRAAMSDGTVHADPELCPVRKGKHNERWPELPAPQAFEAGVPFNVLLHQGIRLALHRSLAEGFRHRVRAVLVADGPVPVCWYGQQDAAWVGYYDALQRLGLARYGPDEREHLGHWAALARSCGWWWPGEDVCVVVDRPEVIRTEPVPGAFHGEVRAVRTGVRYRDGWHPLLT